MKKQVVLKKCPSCGKSFKAQGLAIHLKTCEKNKDLIDKAIDNLSKPTTSMLREHDLEDQNKQLRRQNASLRNALLDITNALNMLLEMDRL